MQRLGCFKEKADNNMIRLLIKEFNTNTEGPR